MDYLRTGEKLPSLPARLARLTGAIAVVFVGEPATLLTAPASVSTISTIGTTITASIATPVAVESPTATTGTRTAGCGLGTSFVHLQIAATDWFSIQSGDRCGGFGVVGHFHERESAGPSGFAVHCDMDTRDLPEWLEQRAQFRLRRLKTHVAHKQVLHILLSFDL